MAEHAVKIETFVWEGTDRRGKKTKGETNASSITLAKAELRRMGIATTRVKKKGKPLFTPKKPKIVAKDIAVFSRQIATMMGAGVPLVQSFEIVGRGHDNSSMQELIMAIKSDVEAGATFNESLRKHPLYFDELYCNLVAAGEQAGILETLLNKIADYQEKTEIMKSKIKKALAYPIAVVCVSFIVTAILLIFVVPQFEELFHGFGADLPAFTMMVIGLSEFMQSYWWMIVGVLVAAGYVFKRAKKTSRKFNHFLDRMILQAPIVGDIVTKATIARFARTLSTMFAAGVPLVEAMESVAGASGNIIYYDAIMKVREEVSTGQQLQVAMRDVEIFPNMVVQMVAIGEESGALDSMLAKVADFYEAEVDDAVDALSSLIEPIIMSVLGVLVGGLIIAMYLPIFKMGSVV